MPWRRIFREAEATDAAQIPDWIKLKNGVRPRRACRQVDRRNSCNTKGAVCEFLPNQELNIEQPDTINAHSGQNASTNSLENGLHFSVSCFLRVVVKWCPVE